MMSNRDEFTRDVARELFFDTIGGSTTRRNEAYTVTYTKDMGINSKGCLTPHDGLDDVGCLSTHTGQAYEFFECIRHLATKVTLQHPRHTYKMPSLVIRIRHTLDVLKDDLRCSQCHSIGGRIVVHETRCHKVYPLVSALGREDDGHKEAERGVVV